MDLMGIIQKARAIQKRIEITKEELKDVEFSSTSGGGLVTVIVKGNLDIKKIEIDDSLLKKEEKGVLIDLIIAAHNDATVKAREAIDSKMKELTSDLPLPPGFKIPGFY